MTKYIDITYDGLALTVIYEYGECIEICAASDGTEISHIFTDCVQRLIYSAAMRKHEQSLIEAKQERAERIYDQRKEECLV